MGIGRGGDFQLARRLHLSMLRNDATEDLTLLGDDVFAIAQGKPFPLLEPSGNLWIIPKQRINPSQVVPSQQVTVILEVPVLQTPGLTMGLLLGIELGRSVDGDQSTSGGGRQRNAPQ